MNSQLQPCHVLDDLHVPKSWSRRVSGFGEVGSVHALQEQEGRVAELGEERDVGTKEVLEEPEEVSVRMDHGSSHTAHFEGIDMSVVVEVELGDGHGAHHIVHEEVRDVHKPDDVGHPHHTILSCPGYRTHQQPSMHDPSAPLPLERVGQLAADKQLGEEGSLDELPYVVDEQPPPQCYYC